VKKCCQCFSKRQLSTVKSPSSDEVVFKQLTEVVKREAMPCFSFKGKTFRGLATNIYDGDTFSLIFVYNGETIKYRCRSLGYDSPEMKPSLQNANRDKEKEMAKIAKTRFQELLMKNPNGTVRVLCHNFDKYGRILVEIWNDVDQKSINDIMMEEGHGKKYDGGKKDSWDF
jgi:endonuclease YncB( thermonuclease family)